VEPTAYLVHMLQPVQHVKKAMLTKTECVFNVQMLVLHVSSFQIMLPTLLLALLAQKVLSFSLKTCSVNHAQITVSIAPLPKDAPIVSEPSSELKPAQLSAHLALQTASIAQEQDHADNVEMVSTSIHWEAALLALQEAAPSAIM